MGCPHHPEVVDTLSPCSRCRASFCQDCLVQIGGKPYCAGCKEEVIRDIQSGAVGTQGPLAGILIRFAALIIDGLVLMPVNLVLFFALVGPLVFTIDPDKQQQPLFMSGMQILYQVLILVVYIVYEGIMLQRRGQTVGKIVVRIKVVNPDGSDIGPGQAWLRPIVRGVLNTCAIINYIPALCTNEKTCVHDLAAKTRVVKLGP